MAGSPTVVVIAGPNGAGKSTAAPFILVETLGIEEFVNADVIAKGLSAFAPEKAAIQAGRVMLDQLHELAERRVNFAFETTLASRSFAPWLAELISQGWHFNPAYLWLAAPDLSVRRVAGRVAQGGHHVPAEVVRRRYLGGLKNFFELYQPIATSWKLYDNSALTTRLIAQGARKSTKIIWDRVTWQRIQEMAKT